MDFLVICTIVYAHYNGFISNTFQTEHLFGSLTPMKQVGTEIRTMFAHSKLDWIPHNLAMCAFS